MTTDERYQEAIEAGAKALCGVDGLLNLDIDDDTWMVDGGSPLDVARQAVTAFLAHLTRCTTCEGSMTNGREDAECNGPRDCVGTADGCRHCGPGACPDCDNRRLIDSEGRVVVARRSTAKGTAIATNEWDRPLFTLEDQ